MKVLVTGGGGQVATALQYTVPVGATVCAPPRAMLDITDDGAVRHVIEGERPDVVINAAAYTAVDQAEQDWDRAFAVNATGAENVARAAQTAGARLVHMSTDFVFDGRQDAPYAPGDATNPLSVYGCSKLAGEQAVKRAVREPLILRSAWVYAERGRNFVHTILRLCRERDSLRVVKDQVGSPTWATSIARAIWRALERNVTGLHHWTDAGIASWHEFAVAIQDEALAAGLLERAVPIVAIPSVEYPTPARRPAYSVLDTGDFSRKAGLTPTPWRDNLRQMLRNLKDA